MSRFNSTLFLLCLPFFWCAMYICSQTVWVIAVKLHHENICQHLVIIHICIAWPLRSFSPLPPFSHTTSGPSFHESLPTETSEPPRWAARQLICVTLICWMPQTPPSAPPPPPPFTQADESRLDQQHDGHLKVHVIQNRPYFSAVCVTSVSCHPPKMWPEHQTFFRTCALQVHTHRLL